METPFADLKSQVMSCIEILLDTVNECAEKGVFGDFSVSQDAVITLQNNVYNCTSLKDLEQWIAIGRSLEKNISAQILRHGSDTTSLSWPKISAF